MDEPNRPSGQAAGPDEPRLVDQLQQFADRISLQIESIQQEQQALRYNQEQDRQRITEELQRLHPDVNTGSATGVIPELAQGIPTPGPVYIKRKATLPDPKRFDGLRKNFRPWQLEMTGKLRVDGLTIGSLADQFTYIYSRLDNSPQAMAAAFYENNSNTENASPINFLKYLDTCYGDPNLEQRAQGRLETMRQGDRENFANFLPRFEKELAESGGSAWSNSVQINALKRVINADLRSHLANQLNLPQEYTGFVKSVQNLGANLEELRFLNKKPGSRYNPPNTNRDRDPDTMEWESTKINSTTTTELRECFICGKKGHIAKNCRDQRNTNNNNTRNTNRSGNTNQNNRPSVRIAKTEPKPAVITDIEDNTEYNSDYDYDESHKDETKNN